jgi:ABC-2 type transport system permease protein
MDINTNNLAAVNSQDFSSNTKIAFWTILNREIGRIFRIWKQTILPDPISRALYLLIFGTFIGRQINLGNGLPYIDFIAPGLILMTIITNSFSNTSSSFYGAKWAKWIEEMLVAPVPNYVILWGFVLGGVYRGILNGFLVYITAILFGAQWMISFLPVLLIFGTLAAIIFSLLGFYNAIFAKNFDDISIIPTFVLVPMTYLGGVFYPIKTLPNIFVFGQSLPIWQWISQINPLVYLIDGFRYGFYGVAEYNVLYSMLFCVVVAVFMFWINLSHLRKGTNIKS